MKELDYKDVKVQFKVTEPTKSNRILTNYAQITKKQMMKEIVLKIEIQHKRVD